MDSKALKGKLQILRSSTQLAIKKDADLMHKVYMLETRIALHEIKKEWYKIPGLLEEYEKLGKP